MSNTYYEFETNPWTVPDLDEYLYYCCPQCDTKCKTKPLFIDHACNTHPEARECGLNSDEVHVKIEAGTLEIKSDICDYANVVIKEETKEYYNDFHEYWNDQPEGERLQEGEDPLEEDLEISSMKRKRKKINYNVEQASEFNEFSNWKPKKKKKKDAQQYKGPFQCYRCGIKDFKKLSEIKEHLTEIHFGFRKIHYGKPRDYQCQLCHAMYETEERLTKHTCSLNPEFLKKSDNKCEICNMEFDRRQKLVLHNQTFHVMEKKFVCDYPDCDFKSKQAKNLMAHKQRKHEQKCDEVCHICGKAFFDIYSLKNHLETAHNSTERSYICDKCGASYFTRHALQHHVREKHPVYYLCTCCEKLFQSTTKLRVHYCNEHNVTCGLKDYYVCWKCQKCCSSFKDLGEYPL